jgi:hypothetical protein
MVHLSKFIHTETGKYVMSLLLGFGLATFFRTICKGRNCILFYAPPLEEIENKIYKYDNKCYKYVANSAKCDINKKIIEFA